MNSEQLHAWITRDGSPITDEFYGHVNVLLDTFTGRVLSLACHPSSEGRSMTVLVASCEIEAMNGTLLAGGTPTVHGDVTDTWLDVCEKAITGATVVATAYAAQLFDAIGFSAGRFLESDTAQAMTDEVRSQHLEARLNYAATVKFVNSMVTKSLDLEGEAREQAIQAMGVSDQYLELVAKVLHEVDGQ